MPLSIVERRVCGGLLVVCGWGWQKKLDIAWGQYWFLRWCSSAVLLTKAPSKIIIFEPDLVPMQVTRIVAETIITNWVSRFGAPGYIRYEQRSNWEGLQVYEVSSQLGAYTIRITTMDRQNTRNILIDLHLPRQNQLSSTLGIYALCQLMIFLESADRRGDRRIQSATIRTP